MEPLVKLGILVDISNPGTSKARTQPETKDAQKPANLTFTVVNSNRLSLKQGGRQESTAKAVI